MWYPYIILSPVFYISNERIMQVSSDFYMRIFYEPLTYCFSSAKSQKQKIQFRTSIHKLIINYIENCTFYTALSIQYVLHNIRYICSKKRGARIVN